MIIFNWIEISLVSICFKQVTKLVSVVQWTFLSFRKAVLFCKQSKITPCLKLWYVVVFQQTKYRYSLWCHLSALSFSVHIFFCCFRHATHLLFRKSLENVMIISMTWPVKSSGQKTNSKTSIIHTVGLCWSSSIYVDKVEVAVIIKNKERKAAKTQEPDSNNWHSYFPATETLLQFC